MLEVPRAQRPADRPPTDPKMPGQAANREHPRQPVRFDCCFCRHKKEKGPGPSPAARGTNRPAFHAPRHTSPRRRRPSQPGQFPAMVRSADKSHTPSTAPAAAPSSSAAAAAPAAGRDPGDTPHALPAAPPHDVCQLAKKTRQRTQEGHQQKQKRRRVTHCPAASAAIADDNNSRTIDDNDTPRRNARRRAALSTLPGREMPVGLQRSAAFLRGFGITMP